ncbi:MAG: VanZ family protein [Clostridium sp.]|nr:VanZ family protein [Clostridium sp.]
MRKKIFLLLAILWMGVIFWFSSRNAELSAMDSTRIGRAIAEMLAKGFTGWDESAKEAFVLSVDHAVRKTAHFLEYMILGILLSGVFAEYRMRPLRWMKRVWISGTLYAVTDELHQIFTPGRSCQLSDVILDSCGVAAGILLALLVLWLTPVWKTLLYRMGFGG